MNAYERYLEELVTKDEIPAAVYLVKHHQQQKTLRSAGSFLNNEGERISVTTDTYFDLASLTKVICTLPGILFLHERKELHIDDEVTKYVPGFPQKGITIRHFLQHTSGVSADLSVKNRYQQRDVWKEILSCKAVHPPDTQVLYSDIGMIALGKIVEAITNQGLDAFADKELYQPWGMKSTGFLPRKIEKNKIAATEKVYGKYVHGEVHDEKAYHLGGVSGSAGLFSNISDVALYADYWLYPEKQSILKPETMALIKENVIQNRGLGFEVLCDKTIGTTSGSAWSNGSFGHTGFTGTSLWIDPKEEIVTVLLTNMVHYGRQHRLSDIRRKFHTLVYETLTS
ncbi:serine hydrolase domain-containing protein [Oceanobacillus jeddahense]|uniref:Beta-lactamase family protein n=1 Tax=Oceanobacillus jeddahense TaxID=1462527 RepID=A0ABY5JYV3_9BACI|nr:serine hydrolase domain-containing protein [Oceanobacillus jeddahense]UUI03699.1 beta-lactamase family protein [Oceanobacillus jeddahense]